MSDGDSPTRSEDDFARREADAGGSYARDTTPALGHPGQPGEYRRGVEGAPVALHRGRWADGRWSFLYGAETGYSGPDADGAVPAAARRARTGDPPEVIQGPVMKPAVWTWEVPLYFWLGGIASGASFIGLACDLADDHPSAVVARRVALATAVPCAPLLIKDLGRPTRFLYMLRIFKPRSPMSMGAWCLFAFSNAAGAAVTADLLGLDRIARALGGVTAALGSYLGSYTGVLLATTAVPVWSRSRLFLGPIFICTAVATGAAATRLTLVAAGMKEGHPTRISLGRIETGAMAAELAMSSLNEHRIGRVGNAFEQGAADRLFDGAKWAVRTGLALRFARRRGGPWVHHVASVLYLGAGLAFRYAWVAAGHNSANDDEAVALTARGKGDPEGRAQP